MRVKSLLAVAVLAPVVSLLCESPVSAATIWTDWTTAHSGSPGSAAGTVNGVAVAYSGEVLAFNTTATANIWSSPASSFVGGTSATSPSAINDAIFLQGLAGTNTLTFVKPIENPVFAIWSLGSPSIPATFTFNARPTFEAGGSDIYGGSAITVNGNTVSGREGSGVVQFSGTYSSISWTDTPEYYYGFTVGANGPLVPTPLPAAAWLLVSGLGAFGTLFRTRRHQS